MVVDKLQPLGQKWVDKFAASYLLANGGGRLPNLVFKIISDARREFEEHQSREYLEQVGQMNVANRAEYRTAVNNQFYRSIP